MKTRYCWIIVAIALTLDVRAAEAQCTSTVTPTSVSVPQAATTGSLSVVSGTQCSWTAVSNDSWITVTSATGSGIGSVNYSVAANTTGASRTGTMTVAGKTVTLTQSASGCASTVTPTTVTIAQTGSTGSSLSVVSGTQCTWTAVSNDSWITVTSATGSGIGQVNYTVAANTTGVSRTGTMTVAGQTVTVTQPGSGCGATVTPTSVSVPSIGSTGSSLSVATGTSCTWTAVSNVGWITVTSATGSGIGQVNYTVAANSTGSDRIGTMSVAGQTVTFTQAGSGCGATVTPTSVAVPSIGQTSALSVTSGTSCTWTAVSNVGWITVTSATGSGIGQVNYTVAANSTGVDRTGTMTVGGQTVTFTQSGTGCSATVTPTSVTVPSIGQTSALSVTAGTQCTWTAVSNVPWITVTSATGSGIGQVNYTVAANSTGVDRTGTMTVGGQTITFTQAASSCTYSVTPLSVNVGANGGASALSVSAGTQCTWSAVSNVAWITVTSATGSGIGQVNYTAAKNTGAARTGTMTVAGQTVTLTQAAGTTSTPPTPPSNLRIIR
jgi:hypothetical protein